MKKAVAAFLLVLFIFNSAGYYCLYELNRFQVKKAVHSSNTTHPYSLTVLKIRDADRDPSFQRLDKLEIRFNGNMYDIIKEVKTEKFTIFYCLRDTKEEDLLAVMKTNNSEKTKPGFLMNYITLVLPHIQMAMHELTAIQIVFPHLTLNLNPIQLSTWTPPPEVT